MPVSQRVAQTFLSVRRLQTAKLELAELQGRALAPRAAELVSDGSLPPAERPAHPVAAVTTNPPNLILRPRANNGSPAIVPSGIPPR